MAARGLGVRELARTVPCNPGHISNLRSGKARPSPELAEVLDEPRSRYTIGYDPSASKPLGTFCRFRVAASKNAVRC